MNISTSLISAEVLEFNYPVFKFASLDSTNVFLKSNHKNYPDFSVIYTENQTSGKGRFERKWYSGSGKGLTFSIKVPLTSIPSQNWCNITQIMALSVSYALEDLAIAPSIRWPNDVIIDDAKLCGILGELVQTDTGYTLVLGVGLNINECEEDFQNIDRKATSLFIETGKVFSPLEILDQVLFHFSKAYEQLVLCGYQSFVNVLEERLFKSDSLVKVLSGDTEYTGIVMGLTGDGLIRLNTTNGIIDVLSGEITSRV